MRFLLSGCAAWLVSGSPLLPAQAPAELPQDPGILAISELLNTPVITATRSLQRADRAPATVIVVTSEQIRDRRYRSLVDLLRDLPDMKVDEASDYVGYNSVTIRGLRGFSTQKIMILLDGVRITGPTNEPVPLMDNFPLYFAKQVEVVYGPGSALYGADAFSGVINIITRKGGGGDQDVAAAGGTGGLRYGRFYSEIELNSASTFMVAGHASYDSQPDLSGKFPQDFAGVSSWQNLQPRTPIDSSFEAPLQATGLLLRLSTPNLWINLFHRYTRYPSNTANSPSGAIYNADVFLGMVQDTFSMEYRDRFGAVESQSTLSGQRLAYNPASNYRNLFTNFEHGYKYAYSNSGRFEQQLTFSPHPAFTLTGGCFMEESLAIPQLPELDEPVRTDRPVQAKLLGSRLDADVFMVRDTQSGAYLQVHYAPLSVVSLVGGIRMDRSDRYGSTTNPRLGLVVTPSPDSTFKLLYGSAFLAPSPFDAYAYYGALQPDSSVPGGFFAYFMHLPNPNLKPQTLRTWEFTARTSLGESSNLGLDLYRTKVRDLFVQAPDAGNTNYYGGHFRGWPVGYIEVFVNQGEQTIRGGSLKLDVIRNPNLDQRLHVYASVSYLDGKIADALSTFREVELPNIAPWTAHLGMDLSWEVGGGHDLTLSPRFTWIGRQRLLDTIPGDPDHRRAIGGYSRLDLSMGFKMFRSLECFLDIQNALDARYRNVSPQSNLNPIEFVGTPQNPRRFTLGIEWRFGRAFRSGG